MPHSLNIGDKTQYVRDIKKLRKIGRTRANDNVVVSYGANNFTAIINTLNYYLIGLTNPNGTFYFRGVPGNAHYGLGGGAQMQVGENYNDLGYSGRNRFPSATPSECHTSLRGYMGAQIRAGANRGTTAVSDDERRALCTLIFLLCEATRFESVLEAMSGIVENNNATDLNALHGVVTNWSNRQGGNIAVFHHV